MFKWSNLTNLGLVSNPFQIEHDAVKWVLGNRFFPSKDLLLFLTEIDKNDSIEDSIKPFLTFLLKFATQQKVAFQAINIFCGLVVQRSNFPQTFNPSRKKEQQSMR